MHFFEGMFVGAAIAAMIVVIIYEALARRFSE